ncbi:MAG: Gfo/Idh/MocA family oxidoreductase [Clostridiales bacterium]|jgi:predicted dehydrogenase|nr:Gfo/Idh/MocA family oxidoreductase [Clostridiales bacterium]HOB63915.1 Gfo/Idh/MocA family oxidoreductase [Clostridia bacterium]
MIRYAVIGIGRMGSVHANNLAKGRIKGARLVAVCDTDTQKLKDFGAKFPKVALFEDHKTMLSSVKPDAVIVATPHYSHVELVCDALNAGVNVLSEKPAAVEACEAQKAIELAKSLPHLKYGIMYNQRTNRMYAYAKKLLDSGALGEIKRVTLTITDWYRSQHYYDQGGWRACWCGEGGGLLINQCVHQLDVLQWLTGMPVFLTAWAATKNRDITVENDVVAIMDYANGAKCVFTASGHELNGTNLLEIAGDKGRITIGKFKMKYLKFAKSETEVNATTTKGYGRSPYKVKKLTYGIRNILSELRTRGQQANIIRNFTNCLLGKAELIAPGSEGIKALSIINAIYLSAYNGNKKVELPLDYNEYCKLLQKLKEEEKIQQ